jgi:hypothetical protein
MVVGPSYHTNNNGNTSISITMNGNTNNINMSESLLPNPSSLPTGLGNLMDAISLSLAKDDSININKDVSSLLPHLPSPPAIVEASPLLSNSTTTVLSSSSHIPMLEPLVSRKRKANLSSSNDDKPSTPIDYASRRSHSTTTHINSTSDNIIKVDNGIMTTTLILPLSPSSAPSSPSPIPSMVGTVTTTTSNGDMDDGTLALSNGVPAPAHAPPQKRPRKATADTAMYVLFIIYDCPCE